ncbi:DUF2029 domain-containing protein [Knoellia aerolata]|uniref:DUF2029 domain-containing protein n=1 Tax=Knoellia aerolata DSM 18566 TaxID=1385519 RepID=A0A0A0JYC9_9MICO|nr:DUF2029 domain-containing protein [Knoellia aerolata]KGN41072.1 hypothetical protein N801_09390 [Knoellia aerolata DSM 18566]
MRSTAADPTSPSTRSTATTAYAACALAAAWLAYLGVLQWSVVRFRVPIVLTLTVCAVGLALWLGRRTRIHPAPAWLVPVVLLGSVAVTWAVPLFSYLRGGPLTAALATLTVVGVGGAALLSRPTAARARTAYGLAVAGHVVTATIATLGDPAPRIDVWVTLQQASDALARGENFYDMTWTDSPGVQDAFTYLPWTAVLLAPGRWLGGDVRWAIAFWSVVLFLGVWALARPLRGDEPSTARATALRAAVPVTALVVAPGALTQIDQAWTEPLLAAGLVWWAVLVRRGHAWWAVVPLALACASKQHLALLLPLLLLWQPFGPRRAVATGALTGVLVAPWFLASPSDFVHDTVTLLLGFHPIRFANTWYLYFLNEHGVTLPFWVTGVIALGALAVAALLVHRRQPPLDELLRWCALVLLAANLVNKQAFYNQFWLSAALVAMSLAVPRGHGGALPSAARRAE